MFCKNCGNKLNEESKFCDKCGLELNIENKKNSKEPVTIDSKKGGKLNSEKLVLQFLFGMSIVLGIISLMQNNEGTFFICLVATLFFAYLIDKINKQNK